MPKLLDIIGAISIVVYAILVTIFLNTRMSKASTETKIKTVTQRQSALTINLMEFYFYKVGYNVAEEKITIADSTRLKFNSDLHQSGIVSSYEFNLGDVSDLPDTENPNDFPIYLSEDHSLYSIIVGQACEFKFGYADSKGATIAYDSLKLTRWREKIRGIKIWARFESSEPIDSVYQTVDWIRTIIPRNIGY